MVELHHKKLHEAGNNFIITRASQKSTQLHLISVLWVEIVSYATIHRQIWVCVAYANTKLLFDHL